MTLRVYWRILGLDKNESIGVRSIQWAMVLSSPSVASHHLEKLKGLGLLEKAGTGEYPLVNQVNVGVLRNFVGVMGFPFPPYILYSALFSALLVPYPVMYPPNL